MDDELKIWLHDQFMRSNIKKYHCYFEAWYANLTKSQLYYFGLQKRHIENGSLTKWITK